MIRPAKIYDLDGIEESYREHFEHERAYGAYMVFREGFYPTRQTAERTLKNGALFVYEERGTVLGSVILDDVQPEEYRAVDRPGHASDDRIRVIHLLMIRPGAAGKGIGSALIRFAVEAAVRALQAEGITRVCLNFMESNEHGKAFWTEKGWEKKEFLGFYSKSITDQENRPLFHM